MWLEVAPLVNSIPTFAARRKAWSSPPVDDIGYLPAEELLALSDEEFHATMTAMWHNRYEGWRNYRSRWVDMFGLNREGNLRVLDYGCGVGMEGAQFANSGHRVWLADIVPENLLVAHRLFGLYNLDPERRLQISASPPFVKLTEQMDVIHCVGVLHHIPNAREVMERFAEILAPGGRVNLMVYSDRAWRKATGKPPPNGPVEEHPAFERFWQTWDPIGGYADWYSRGKLVQMFGEWFKVAQTANLTRDGEYLGAVLVKR
jgi:SAM-dependent methyltransferase